MAIFDKIFRGTIANDNTGDPLRTGGQIINDNFEKAVSRINSVDDIHGLTPDYDGQVVTLTGWHPDTIVGGGQLVWDANGSKSDHNGGTVFSPTVPAPSEQASIGDYLDGVGETDPSGQGVYRRKNAESFVWVEWFGAKGDNSFDDYPSIAAARDTGSELVLFGAGRFRPSQTIEITQQSQQFIGVGRWTEGTFIEAATSFTGSEVFLLSSTRGQRIANMAVFGSIVQGVSAIQINGAGFVNLENMFIKFGTSGLLYRKGNNLNIYNVFFESNDYGIVVQPTASADTNGCNIQACRVFASNEWGIDIRVGDSGAIHMHSTWDISCEGNQNGIRIAPNSTRYNTMNLYSESNTLINYALSNDANYYITKNPDNDSTPDFDATFKGVSLNFSGDKAILDIGYAPLRYKFKSFSASGSLADEAIRFWRIENTSGSTRGLNLAFLDYAPVGFSCRVVKTDNTSGFILNAPAGYTLVGDTSDFGAGVSSIKWMDITKTSSSEAIVIQGGA